MDILITGCKGLLASRLIQELLMRNHNIYCSSRSKLTNDLPAIDIFEADINKLSEKLKKIDFIIHTAGIPYQKCIDNPLEAIKVNSLLTARLGQAGLMANIKKFIYFSTLRVFKDIVEPSKYDKLIPNNFDFYANTKFCGERFLNSIFLNNSSQLKILRLANICCSPTSISESHRQTVFNDICYQAINYKKIQIKSNKNTLRDFVPFHILNDNVISLIENENNNHSLISFISSHKLFTINSLSERVVEIYKKKFGGKIPINFLEESDQNQCDLKQNVINSSIFDYEIELSLDFYKKEL